MPQKLLIIIPCYNEEASLPIVLTELSGINIPADHELKVIVINDCSTDKTKRIAEKFNTTVLDLPMNLGIGGAVQAGFKYALSHHFDLVIQLDGDGQHPPSEIIKLLNADTNNPANIIIGSRFMVKEGYQSSAIRRVAIKYFSWLNKLLTGTHLYDCTSGFRLLDKKAISIAAQNYPDDYPEPESLIIFTKAGLSIKETPVIMRSRLGGKSSINHATSLFYIVKVTFGMLFSYIRN